MSNDPQSSDPKASGLFGGGAFLKGLLGALQPLIIEVVKKLLEGGVPAGAQGAPADLDQRVQRAIQEVAAGK